MELKEFIEKTNIDPGVLSSILDVSYKSAERWTKGECEPSQMAERIFQRLYDEVIKKA